MEKPVSTSKKPYRRPVLERYGDLRTLTRGGGLVRNESNTVGATTKTKPGGG
ncbi:MAG: lasso RiPP family leader peptide-containing protein [Candidatus Rokubacteria bacterium]|nr:lasso RiPP family leader peptide-containing protein [Candidatus Rokubacteria bacterium]